MAIGDGFNRSLTFGLGFESGESLGVDITDEESLVRTQSGTQVLCHGIPHDPEAWLGQLIANAVLFLFFSFSCSLQIEDNIPMKAIVSAGAEGILWRDRTQLSDLKTAT